MKKTILFFIYIQFIISAYSEEILNTPGLYFHKGKNELCPSGYYCPGDGKKHECPDGTFSIHWAETEEDCMKCGCKNGKQCQKGTVKNLFGKIIHAG